MIFGDILGLKAGETWTELTLARFLLPRAARRGVFLVAEADPGVNSGLWVADMGAGGLAATGEGRGRRLGVLPDFSCWTIRGETDVLMGVRFGLEKLADSGSSNVSMWSVSIGSWLPVPEPAVRLFGELSFINDAGVAGDGTLPRTAERGLAGLFCGAI